jgi:hypothetical protein
VEGKVDNELLFALIGLGFVIACGIFLIIVVLVGVWSYVTR